MAAFFLRVHIAMIILAWSVGLKLLFSCTDFDPASPPSVDKPLIQFLLER